MSNEITISVNSKIYGGWENVSITRAMDAIADSFSFSIVDKWRGIEANWELIPGDEIEVNLDGKKILTGYIDSLSPSISAGSRTISISGRSKAGDLVDCSATGPAEFKNQKLEQIIAALIKPFGITVIAKVSTGAAITKATIKTGESVFEFINNQIKTKGLFLVSNADGNLEIYSKGQQRAITAITQGQNLKSASGSFKSKDLFSEYIVKGQKKGKNARGKATDSTVKRFRPKVIVSDKAIDQASAQKEAEWQMNMATAKAYTISCSVVGWTQSDKSLWDRNLIVPFNCPFVGIKNADLLIKSVTLKKDNSGTTADMTLIFPDSYSNETKKKKTIKSGSTVDKLGWGSSK